MKALTTFVLLIDPYTPTLGVSAFTPASVPLLGAAPGST